MNQLITSAGRRPAPTVAAAAAARWVHKHEIGIPGLDGHHQALWEAVARIEVLLRKEAEQPLLEAALNDLMSRINSHFEHEQQVIDAIEMPGHHNLNQVSRTRLLEEVAALVEDGRSGAKRLEAKSLTSLKNWLERHIEENRKVATFFNSTNDVVGTVNNIILSACHLCASDIHIDAFPGKLPVRVRFRIDGALIEHSSIPYNMQNAVISRIKIMANLDIAERRKPQDGRIDYSKFGPATVELRVVTIPTIGGLENVVMRLLSTAKPLPIDDLGLDVGVLDYVKETAVRPHGLFLVSGPTGSGKTTTLHSILSFINTPSRKIWTAEDPIEITQQGLCQVQVQSKIGWTFAGTMRSFLRADPDVIMVGEMRDAETAKIAIEAALTGHLVFSTLHTNSASESVVRLLDLGMDRFSLSDAVQGILAQRLAKRLCDACKVPYRPPLHELRDLLREYCDDTPLDPNGVLQQWQEAFGANDTLTIYAPKGCSACHQTGYAKRIAIHELLVAGPKIKRLIQTAAPVEEIRRAGIGQGMRTLKQNGIEKVLQGLTDLQQIRAVCG